MTRRKSRWNRQSNANIRDGGDGPALSKPGVERVFGPRAVFRCAALIQTEITTLTYARRITGLSGLSIALLLGACSGGSGGDIATVNGQGISRATFEQRLDATPVAKQTLNQLIQGALIDQYAKDNNVQISESDIDKKLDEIKAKYQPGQLEQILKQQGLTEDDVRRIVRQQMVLEKAIGKNIHVSDADVKAYYAKNEAQFDTPEQVHAKHILVPDLKTADMVEAQLKSGAKFDDLAKKYSTDPSSKDKGGDLGFFGRKQMVPAFEAAAFSQPLNVIGAPVKSPFGYHIIVVLGKRAAHKATLADSSDTIRKQLVQQQIATQVQPFLANLKSKAKIDVSDPQFKDVAAPAPAMGS